MVLHTLFYAAAELFECLENFKGDSSHLNHLNIVNGGRASFSL